VLAMVSRRIVWLFFAYGLVLCLFGLIVAGFGHGTFTLLGLAGAPLSFFGVPMAIAASLTQWGMLFLARRRFGIAKLYLVAFLALHYASAALLLLLPSSAFSDWEYVRRIPGSYRFLLAVGFGWYCAGQMFVWKVVVSQPASA
jgi:hypothetical protein